MTRSPSIPNPSYIRKAILSTAVGVALGLTAAGATQAEPVISLELKDFNADGLKSDFAFASRPTGNGALTFGSGVTVETGCVNANDGNNCDPITFGSQTSVGTDVQGQPRFEVGAFATGFNFGGQGPFHPNIAEPSGVATVEATLDPVLAASGDGQAVQFTALELGGVYHPGATIPGFTTPGQQFYLQPDHLTNCSGSSPSYGGTTCGAAKIGDNTGPVFSTPFGYNVDITDQGGGDYGVVIRYVGTIGLNPANPDPSGAFVGQPANWRLEGIMSIPDAPPLVTIDPPNPQNPAANIPYVDPGASCFDAFDGAITSTGPGIPSFVKTDDNASSPNTGLDGNSFTVTYTCTDSANQTTVTTRDVNVGSDTEVPVITLLASDNPGGACRSDSPDGTSVDILEDAAYIDAGAICEDNSVGDIPLGTSGPGTLSFLVDDDSVNTSDPVIKDITFTCNDAANNGPVNAVRTVSVIGDNQPPQITIPEGTEIITLTKGGELIVPPATCRDINPVCTGGTINLGTTGQPGFTVTPDPSTIDTNIAGDTILVYECVDAVGNVAEPASRTVRVVAGQSFNILSMTISDTDADAKAGCFRFNSLNLETCELANRFSSDGSAETGFADEANKTLPGSGTDLDEEDNPIGVRFGSFQATDEISPGFNFSGFPFVPFTFDPPSADAVPPAGTVTIIDENAGEALLDFTSMPWGGLYNSNTPNEFYMPPDPGTLSTTVTQINNDDDGNTRTFNYRASWTHIITPVEDPTGAFINFNSFWRLEGVITADSTPVVLNNPPLISSLSAAQGASDPTVDITRINGIVTVNVSASDPDGNNISYDWSGSDSELVSLNGTTNSGFVFDPSGLDDGIYQLVIEVSDDATPPLSANAQILLRVTANGPSVGSGDSNGNGISDDIEGFGDADNDHIPDYRDVIDGRVMPTRNQVDFSDAAKGDIVVDTGRLVLGNTAFATGQDVFTVTENDIAKFGGPGGKPVDNAFDRLNKVDGLGHSGGGIYDLIVTNLPESGAPVRIVLPQAVKLPVQPVYRWYVARNGWIDFQTGSGNALASAMRINGECPAPDDVTYDNSLGLVAGDDCVRLTIVDGGVNDADLQRNAIVVDPGTVTGNGPVAVGDASGSSGCALANVPVAARHKLDWLLLSGFLVWLGWNRRKRTH